MNNFNFYMKSFQIHKVYFITAIFVISCFITACASNNALNQSKISVEKTERSNNFRTISTEEIEHYRDKQQQWLSGLWEGMSPGEALRQVFSYLQYSFQYKENGKLFQYFQGQYPITGMMFGLFFENGRLTSLLLDQAAYDFFWCRYNYGRVWGHLFQYWLPNGFQKTASWIRLHNRLEGKYDDVSTVYQQNLNNNEGASEASEAIITSLFFLPLLPYALLAMPFLPDEEITEDPANIDGDPDEQPLQGYGQPEKLIEVASKIELGVTTENELIQLLGTPDYKGDTSWTYKTPDIKFGIVKGTVVWSESWSTVRLHLNNKIKHNKDVRCEPSN